MSILFTPFKLGSLVLQNRLVMAPMQQYCATEDGEVVQRHVDHYARRAAGGVGLVIVEATSVADNGRLMLDDLGLFDDAHIGGLRRIAEAVHAHGVPTAAQLVHGGRKAIAYRGSVNLAPSAIGYGGKFPDPREMTLSEIEQAISDFADAARRAVAAGFDVIEIHAAHGFLIHQFLSPLSNARSDMYGGDESRRARFLHEVVSAVRSSVPSGFPILVRLSASDYVATGLDTAQWARALQSLAAEINGVHVSSGGLLPLQPPATDEGYQVPFAAELRRSTGLPTIAVGNIRSPHLAQMYVNDGAADLIALGRPLLEDADVPLRWKEQLSAA